MNAWHCGVSCWHYLSDIRFFIGVKYGESPHFSNQKFSIFHIQLTMNFLVNFASTVSAIKEGSPIQGTYSMHVCMIHSTLC